MTTSFHALGLMSGSSLDGLDLACCTFMLSDDRPWPRVVDWRINQAETLAYPAEWVNRLSQAPDLSGRELWALHTAYGQYLGQRLADYLQQHRLSPDLIASHGHTIFHDPTRKFTTQIGDGAAISVLTGLTTVSDFRSQDIAAGGQGAPLAPLADRLLLSDYDFCLNLGGISNLSARCADSYVAFDIGGANQILNALVQPLGMAYDDKGKLARQGKYLPELAQQQDSLAYFRQQYPKSLGNDWVREQQTQAFVNYEAAIPDKLHTACRHMARQVAQAVQQVGEREKLDTSQPGRMVVTGGGAYNDFLIECIQEALPAMEVELPERQIIDYKEAALMALMGCLRLLGLPNCMRSVTGADFDTCGGVIHQAKPAIPQLNSAPVSSSPHGKE